MERRTAPSSADSPILRFSGSPDPLLSACMMVRDEERNLPRCLSSIRGLVDEIVVVDTGSTDRTLEICREFGARVYEHPWADDFSLHRNQSLGYATGDWLLVTDADEELVWNAELPQATAGQVSSRSAEQKTELLNWLKAVSAQYRIVSIGVDDFQHGRCVNRWNSIRMFRPGAIHYEHPVHNMPTGEGASALCPLFRLKHTGYDLSPEKKAAKHERTRRLLQRRLQENPDDWQPYFYLSQMEDDAGRLPEAMALYATYIEHKAENESQWNASVWFSAVKCAIRLGDCDRAAAWLEQGLAEIPDDLDLAYAGMELALAVKSPALLYDHSVRYAALYDRYQADPALSGARFTYSFSPREYTHALFHVVTQSLQWGMKNLARLEQALAATGEEFQASVKQDLARDLGKLGIRTL